MTEKKKTTKTTAAKSATNASGVRVLTPQEFSLSADNAPVAAPRAFAVYVRSLLQNWRQGTVAVKGRADVSFSNKKPWRQKGTGRARAGSPRSPLWRKGGVCHGPQQRTRTLCVPQGLKQRVMGRIFWDYLTKNNIVVIDRSLPEKPKTSAAAAIIKDAGFGRKPVTVFIQPHDMLARASFGNMKNVRLVMFDHANAFDLTVSPSWLLFEKDMPVFKEMVQRWL